MTRARKPPRRIHLIMRHVNGEPDWCSATITALIEEKHVALAQVRELRDLLETTLREEWTGEMLDETEAKIRTALAKTSGDGKETADG